MKINYGYEEDTKEGRKRDGFQESVSYGNSSKRRRSKTKTKFLTKWESRERRARKAKF